MTMLRDLIPQDEIKADLELLNDDSYYYGETGQKVFVKVFGWRFVAQSF